MNEAIRREVCHATPASGWPFLELPMADQSLVVQVQGSVCQLRQVRRVPERLRHKIGKRGAVHGLSKRGRLRYLSTVGRLKIIPQAWQFVTLTFGRERSWRECKSLLDRWFCECLSVDYPEYSAFWGQEFGEQGRLHFHLLVRAPITRGWVQRSWHKITKDLGGQLWVVERDGRQVWNRRKGWQDDSDQGASRYSTREGAQQVARRRGGCVRQCRVLVGCVTIESEHGAMFYCAKYMSKEQKASYGRESGRCWGARGRARLPWAEIQTYIVEWSQYCHDRAFSAACRSPDYTATWFFCGHERTPETPGHWALAQVLGAMERIQAARADQLPWVA